MARRPRPGGDLGELVADPRELVADPATWRLGGRPPPLGGGGPPPSLQATSLTGYFTAPAVMPRTMKRSSRTATMISGKIAANETAAMAHQLMPWLPV